jgi:probable blue pigment (indigoidine) exporter
VDVSVLFQTGLRMAVFTVLATLAAKASGSPILTANLFSQETILTGLLNLLHVGSSYTAFDQLAGGNAMALFYTYPVWNIIGAATVLKETVPYKSFPWIGLALLGAILLAHPSQTNWTLIGVFAALTAAITETGIYLWFRAKKDESESKSDQPWTKMIQMYGSSGLLWILGVIVLSMLGLIGKNVFKISGGGFASILLFNSLVGFVGYALRFYLIPKVSTVAFSSLSFIGIFAAYISGWLFTNETPTLIQGLGAVAIVIANTVLLRREIA